MTVIPPIENTEEDSAVSGGRSFPHRQFSSSWLFELQDLLHNTSLEMRR